MLILTIVGTRPQFIKMPLLSKKFKENNITEVVIHSGQHFDLNMSESFFKNLEIPKPDYYLNINSGLHANMTGRMMIEIETIILKIKPNYVLVYGDCDTTLAGSIASVKLNIPIIHVESGLRSFDRNMPEEINRVLVDHISTILFCPTTNAVENLKKEGITKNVYLTGDLMIELLRKNLEKIKNGKDILESLQLEPQKYILMTLHRKENTNKDTVVTLMQELKKIELTILFPIHPRTRKVVIENNIIIPTNVKLIDPINFWDMMTLSNYSFMVMTDSGGLQKEAFELDVPCITLRDTTEWIETLKNNRNILLKIDSKLALNIKKFINLPKKNKCPFLLKNPEEKMLEIIRNSL